MEPMGEQVRNKLKEYNEEDIFFLKTHWQKWLEEKRFELIEQKTGANVQVIYGILSPSKIKSIKQANYYPERYELTLVHSRKFDIVVIIVFDQPVKGKLGIVTYYKHLMAR